MSRVRLVALDLDGTLLDSRGEASDEDAAALRSFHRDGVVVVLASGRMTSAVRPWYDKLGVDGPVISYNGAMARDSDARGSPVLLEKPLPAPYADELIDYADRHHFHLNYYLDEVLYGKDDPLLRRYADIYTRQTGSVFHFVRNFERFRRCEPTKIILITDPSVAGENDPRRRDEQYEYWASRWAGLVAIMKTNPEYLEFLDLDANKGDALEAICRAYGIGQEETAAFGDGDNDAAMLRWAGVGIAVANASGACRAAADIILAQTNDESPVARAFESALK